MNFKNIILISFLIIFTFSTTVFADIELEEEIDFSSIEQEILETASDLNTEPSINSRSAIVIDRTSKAILYGKEENQIRKMASTTKIMTAIIVLENSNLQEIATVSTTAASIGGSTIGLSTRRFNFCW